MEKLLAAFKLTFTGFIAGYILALALSQWVWLEMRFAMAWAIPLGMAAGLLLGLMKKVYPSRLWLVIPQVILFSMLVVIYIQNLEAILIIPAILFREAFNLKGLSLEQVNLILIGLLVAGNFSWFIRSRKGRNKPQEREEASA